MRLAVTALPVLQLVSSVDVPVTWTPAMPSGNYRVALAVEPGLVGRVTTAVKSSTATGCVVTATRVGLPLGVGGWLFAVAYGSTP